jgi:hypothetical protein
MIDIVVFGKETWKKLVAGDVKAHSLRLRPEDSDLFEHVPKKIEAMIHETRAGKGSTIVWETKTEIRSRASV